VAALHEGMNNEVWEAHALYLSFEHGESQFQGHGLLLPHHIDFA
jgi:hypothetical protein